MPYKSKYKAKLWSRKYHREYFHKHPDRRRKAWFKWYSKAKLEINIKKVIYNREKRRAYRKIALEKYGGIPPVCQCCKENNIEFLGIDHINGGGTKHRKSLLGIGFYKWLIDKRKMPSKYRVLCHNCNLSIGFYKYCPHKGRKNIIR